ncbi:hypothetical protein V6N13_113730 [Hibiscus sabdariffa]|uniref:Uncharacterized protein n=1 Tax=Hibiscus sabdariffa TaxID=183260 RepID=A0ABR2U094_9ROSI
MIKLEAEKFEGLPPPSHHQQPEEKDNEEEEKDQANKSIDQISFSLRTSINPNNKEASPTPVLKSALKRPKPTESNPKDYENYFPKNKKDIPKANEQKSGSKEDSSAGEPGNSPNIQRRLVFLWSQDLCILLQRY